MRGHFEVDPFRISSIGLCGLTETGMIIITANVVCELTFGLFEGPTCSQAGFLSCKSAIFIPADFITCSSTIPDTNLSYLAHEGLRHGNQESADNKRVAVRGLIVFALKDMRNMHPLIKTIVAVIPSKQPIVIRFSIANLKCCRLLFKACKFYSETSGLNSTGANITALGNHTPLLHAIRILLRGPGFYPHLNGKRRLQTQSGAIRHEQIVIDAVKLYCIPAGWSQPGRRNCFPLKGSGSALLQF